MDERDALGLIMPPVIPPRYISLIGLPGSGKTTLCMSLATALGWSAFAIGDALRARAATDPALQNILDQGQLAPESVAIELMQKAAKDAAGQGLVIDGFPRHRDQVELARDLFNPWTVLYLEVPAAIATSRLRDRLSCPICKWVGTNTDSLCPRCGNRPLHTRPEDEPEILSKRICDAESRLGDLLNTLGVRRVVLLDARKPKGEVLQEAMKTLRKGHSLTTGECE